MAQKLAPAEKNSTDISAGSATFCISVQHDFWDNDDTHKSNCVATLLYNDNFDDKLQKRWNSHYAGDLEEMAGLTTTKSETLFLSLTIDIYLGILMILYILY